MDTNFDMQKQGSILAQSTNYRGFNPKEKNFMTAKMKKGSLDQALFSSPGYNSIGDPYVDPRRMKLRSESMAARKGMHGKEFRPGGKFRSKLSGDFLNTPSDTPLVSANRTHGPRGFFTSPTKKGSGPGTLIQKQNYGHMIDEYDRKRDLDREERRMRRTQDLGKGFRNRVKGKRTFGNDYDEYGEDKLNIKDQKKKPAFEGIKHPAAWKYNSESKNAKKTINPLPEYVEEKYNPDSLKPLKAKHAAMPWFPTYNRRSEPSDAIISKYMNRPKYAFMS